MQESAKIIMLFGLIMLAAGFFALDRGR